MKDSIDFQLSVEEQQIINADFAHNYGIIPKRVGDTSIDFFIDESMFFHSLGDELELILGKKIILHTVSSEAIKKLLILYYRKGEKPTSSSLESTQLEMQSKDFLEELIFEAKDIGCLLYTSPSPRDKRQSRMPSSA